MLKTRISSQLKMGIRVAQLAQIQQMSLYSRKSNWITYNTGKRKELNNAQFERKFTLNVINAVNTNENDSEQMDEKVFLDHEVDSDASQFELKTLLYAETDELLQQINKCIDQKELYNFIIKHDKEMALHHRVQSVIVLWDLHQQGEKSIAEPALLNHIVEILEPHVLALDINELSCCYLYLRKMNVPNTHPVLQRLLLCALEKVDKEKLVPLSTLSRLSVAIKTGHEFHTPTVCINFIPHILVHLQTFYSQESARLLAICMHNLLPLIDLEIIDTFKERIQELLDTNILNAQSQKCIFKLLHLFNIPIWSQHNAVIIRNLLLALKPEIPQFNEEDVKMICRIFQHHMEPAALEIPLKKSIQNNLQHSPNADTLACFMPFNEPTKREPLIRLFKKLLLSEEQWRLPHSTVNFFIILRSLKISETKICDVYWSTILNRLESSENAEKTQQKFLRHCHRYMHFNNNLGGTYRYLPLEQKLTEMSMNAIENELAGSIPWKFARLASFVLAYGHTPYCWKKFPNTILSKIISMANQFTPTDCFYLSRGLQICLEMRFRHEIPSTLGMQLATIDNILNSCVERFLQNSEELTIQHLNTIVRTLSNRKTLKNSLVYQQAIGKYKTADYTNINSRVMRDLAYILTASNYIEPKALNAIFDYIKNEHEHILGDSVEKVLTCAYNLGYTPESLDVFEYAAKILIRDFDFMSGFSIVQACLALCFYKMVPEALINKIFCVNFIKRIEDEIQLCYSKATYPERVLNLIMQLNRTVCLDFPEANVPWFQQNFIEAQLSKKPVVRQRFNIEVEDLLKAILKGETFFRCNHTTPYGYQIDFVIHFDKDRKPLPAPAETTMLDRITKVAILLLKLDSFCENDLTALRGPESLKIKHLEMMGYKVLHINEHDWNSKYMNAPGAKTNYLKCLLQITS